MARSKYGNVKVVKAIGKFDSKKEYLRHLVLLDMQRHGEIRGLKRQPRYRLEVNGEHICDYIGDWFYVEIMKDFGGEREVVEDAKGYKTPDWKIKFKLAATLFPTILWRTS